jgi:PAS domain S-box-containing protein
MKREHKIAAGLGPALAILVVIGVVSYRSTARLIETASEVEHTHMILETLQGTLSHIGEAEASVRGYVISGDAWFLEPYEGAVRRVGQDLNQLRGLVVDNPRQQEGLNALEPRVGQKLSRLQRIIELRREQGFDAAANLTREGTGRRMMDDLRRRVTDMESEEQRLLGERNATAHAMARQATFLLVTGSVISFALLFGVVYLLNREIAERQHAEEQSRRSSLYTRGLLEASLDPLVTISKDGRIMDVNQATEAVTGVPRQRLIGSDFSDYFTQPEKARQGYQQVFASGSVRDYPLAIRHTSGGLMDVLYNATVYKNEAGEVEGVFAAARDVTERKRAEQALQAERQRFSDVLDILPAYVALLTPDYHLPFTNRRFRKCFGEPQGQRCFEFLFGRREPCEKCETYQVLKTMAPHDWKWAGPDGRDYEVFDFPFTEADGSTLILEMGVDVTERKRAEDEVRRLNAELEARVAARTAELEATVKELEAFTYSVSHDLRSPLRQISGFAKIVAEDFGPSLPAQAREHLQWVEDGARRMGTLIDDLLNLSRVGRRELQPQLTGLNTLVREAIADLEPETRGRDIEWRLGELPFVECDPALMKQVWANLLSNAVKFTRPRNPAVIEVGAGCEDGYPDVFVRDNGVGFSMKYAGRLFGVFQRLHRVEDFEGTGVGLATVQRIIHKHGGRVWAEAELDKGATFHFTLGGAA